MSRIGKRVLSVPENVNVNVENNVVTVKGPKGELSQEVNPDIKVSVEDGTLSVARPSDEKSHRSLHGLYRSLISNMVVGV